VEDRKLSSQLEEFPLNAMLLALLVSLHIAYNVTVSFTLITPFSV
jgi:hypothetical protein